ncbi:MAG: transglutaminase N-terminal domain-containing protein [Bacteroidota bacterium]
MLYSVEHTTRYQYHELVSLCHNIAALAPRNTDKQTCKAFNIIISPLPEVLEEHIDFFGNKLYYFVVEQEHEELTVTVRSQVEKKKRQQCTAFLSGSKLGISERNAACLCRRTYG